jgi:hypothetical protein
LDLSVSEAVSRPLTDGARESSSTAKRAAFLTMVLMETD